MKMTVFKATNPNGSFKTCKFCHERVLWHVIERRWYELDQKTFHADNCKLRQEHFSNQAYQSQQSKRDSR